MRCLWSDWRNGHSPQSCIYFDILRIFTPEQHCSSIPGWIWSEPPHHTRGRDPIPSWPGCPTQVVQNAPGPWHPSSGPDPQCAWSAHRPSSRLHKHASRCPHPLPSRPTANIAQSAPSYQPLPPEGAEVHPHSAWVACACVLPTFIQARRRHYSISGGCRFHWREASPRALAQWRVLGLRCRPPGVGLCRCDGPV